MKRGVYRELADKLTAEFADGGCRIGETLPSVKELCARHGVGPFAMRHKLEKNPPRQERGGSAAADDLALAKAMCKSLLERMEEAKCVRMAESNLRNDRILKAWRELLAKGEMDRQVQAE